MAAGRVLLPVVPVKVLAEKYQLTNINRYLYKLKFYLFFVRFLDKIAL